MSSVSNIKKNSNSHVKPKNRVRRKEGVRRKEDMFVWKVMERISR